MHFRAASTEIAWEKQNVNAVAKMMSLKTVGLFREVYC